MFIKIILYNFFFFISKVCIFSLFKKKKNVYFFRYKNKIWNESLYLIYYDLIDIKHEFVNSSFLSHAIYT